MVRAGTVLGAGSELASARDDADADKSVSSFGVQPLIIHAVKPSNSPAQADLIGHHYADQSNQIRAAVIISAFMLRIRVLTHRVYNKRTATLSMM